ARSDDERQPPHAHLCARRQGRALWRADAGDEPAARGGIPQARAGRAGQVAVMASALDKVELRLWVVSAVVVLGLHAAGATMLLGGGQEPDEFGDDTAIIVDLSPFTTPPSD